MYGACGTAGRWLAAAVLLLASSGQLAWGQARPFKTEKILYGVAYYDEYMPYDRLDRDVSMMKAAGINVVRIAESTWGTLEPQPDVYDFHHIDRVLAAMHRAGIGVIIGTPTYAVPTWLARQHPDVLAITSRGPNQYGARQNMDITNEHYRERSEKVIRKLLEHVKDHPAIIGYQVDNETKAYGTSGPHVQAQFVAYMQRRYPSLDSLNRALGLNYWSNRINSWADFPSVNGSINASLNGEFARFQRQLVTDFLAWQAAIVREYKKPGQFITQNFDFDWWGHTYGIQPEVNHFAAARALDVAGCDIYHPSQDELTGLEISFGGDVARGMKCGQNYLVLETEAQGFPQWTPYPGQLRLQAFSHLASGADMVEYWHWSSIHNSAETYWKGVLSHDLQPNAIYDEVKTIGADMQRLGPHLLHLQKKNQVAVLFSNDALTGFNAFGPGGGPGRSYNGVLRQLYDELYKLNVSVDFVDPTSPRLEQYKLLVVPALYAAPDSLLRRLNAYVRRGGHVVYTYKSGFANQDDKVRTTTQPGLLAEACGVRYDEFTEPRNVVLKSDYFQLGEGAGKIENWMELLTPTTAKVLARYDHPAWGQYAAITENQYGQGLATYIGCRLTPALTRTVLADAVRKAGLWGPDQQLTFPLITKAGTNQRGHLLHYYFNYSAQPQALRYPHRKGTELLAGRSLAAGTELRLPAWGFAIVEEE
ncbi:beta-galactosidase [Siccationidurans ginsengisoli]|nr:MULTISPECIES: beta-galactosidase [unclassified Hymenobacter]MBO2033614.1 beta-galactosidase [Hymenobacter sp. BT559]